MLIKVNNKIAPSMGLLHYMAMKYIFDNEHWTDRESRVLEDAITNWTHKVNLDNDERIELQRIVLWLEAYERKDEKFLRFMETIKKHNIHYRNLFKGGLPYLKGINVNQ